MTLEGPPKSPTSRPRAGWGGETARVAAATRGMAEDGDGASPGPPAGATRPAVGPPPPFQVLGVYDALHLRAGGGNDDGNGNGERPGGT